MYGAWLTALKNLYPWYLSISDIIYKILSSGTLLQYQYYQPMRFIFFLARV